mmetsp:Transcript_32614/g.50752  ORF Transcript_32614/g.50752 Transcript_32614/m.50752 type:complete len:104 (-) Transcript_32614:1504-1815(-)
MHPFQRNHPAAQQVHLASRPLGLAWLSDGVQSFRFEVGVVLGPIVRQLVRLWELEKWGRPHSSASSPLAADEAPVAWLPRTLALGVLNPIVARAGVGAKRVGH